MDTASRLALSGHGVSVCRSHGAPVLMQNFNHCADAQAPLTITVVATPIPAAGAPPMTSHTNPMATSEDSDGDEDEEAPQYA